MEFSDRLLESDGRKSYRIESEIRDHDFVKSIYLHDPNGILVEIAAPTRALSADDLRKDPKPVPALREILQ